MKSQNMWIAQEAAIEATTQLELIKPSWEQEIDIFSIIEHAGIPLMFRRMKRLFGAYIPAEDKISSKEGILINSNHPRSLQRYTAAHEFAHHIQDKSLSLDEEMEVLERTQQIILNPKERFAEHFASWFLMPPQLIRNLAKKLDIAVKQPEPNAIYQLSLALGTSYKATITQLVTLQEITFHQAEALRQWQPKEIKGQLSWDDNLLNPRNDVWFITGNYRSQHIHPRVGDELCVALREIPSTGYVWVRADSGAKIELLGQRFIEPESGVGFGAEGQHKYYFILTEPGPYNLSLTMQRPWIGIQSQMDEFDLDLLIEEERLGINPDLLLSEA